MPFARYTTTTAPMNQDREEGKGSFEQAKDITIIIVCV